GSVIRLLDAASGKESLPMDRHEDRVLSVAILPGGTAVTADHRALRLWEAATGKLLRELSVPGGLAAVPTVTPDGKVVAAVGGDGVIHLWDAATGKEKNNWKDEGVAGLTVFPDGDTIALCGGSDVRFLSTETGKETRRTAHTCDWVAVSADGRT